MHVGNAVENEYTPTTVTPPGGTIRDLLGEQGMSQAELAERMGRSTKSISNLVNGEATLSQDVALELERVLNVPGHFCACCTSNFLYCRMPAQTDVSTFETV